MPRDQQTHTSERGGEVKCCRVGGERMIIIIAVRRKGEAWETGAHRKRESSRARGRWRVPEAGRAPPTRGGASLHRTEVGRSRAGPAISVAPIGRQASVCGARQHRIRPVLLLRAPRPGPLVGCLSASLACRDEAVMRREKKKAGFIFTSQSLSLSPRVFSSPHSVAGPNLQSPNFPEIPRRGESTF